MSKRTLALAIAATLATPIAGSAQPPEGVVLQSAERAAVGMELQSNAAGRRRSRGRTWAGLVMIASGAVLATAVKRTETCGGDPGTCAIETEPFKALSYPGIGMAVTGVLLATVWSDVPASPHVDFAVTPDRIRIGKTFGF